MEVLQQRRKTWERNKMEEDTESCWIFRTQSPCDVLLTDGSNGVIYFIFISGCTAVVFLWMEPSEKQGRLNFYEFHNLSLLLLFVLGLSNFHDRKKSTLQTACFYPCGGSHHQASCSSLSFLFPFLSVPKHYMFLFRMTCLSFISRDG